ncbi:MAG: trigger factor [Verrucomicrobia bacterium]|nr:trigger factor [Verrucomicrobiota bacterium]
MEAIVEDLSQSKKLIRFSVPAERVAGEIEAALSEVKRSASVKGFRPGHVPERILRTRFAETIRSEAISHLVPQVFREALAVNKLRAIGEPDVQDLKYEKDQPLTFTATIEVLPDFELPPYKGIRVVPLNVEPPTEKEIDELVDSYRQSRATLEPVEGRPVELGDTIICTIEQTLDGKTDTMKERFVEVIEEQLVPGLANELVGIERDATKRFELTIPDDYPGQDLAGKTVAYAVTLHEIKHKRLPELTDGFAKEVGSVESVEALRDKLRTMVSDQRKAEERRRQEHVLLDALANAAHFEVPESLLTKQTERNVMRTYQRAQYSGVPREKVLEQHDEIVKNASVASARQIKLTLLFERIAEAEGITVGDDEIDRWFDDAAARRGTTPDKLRELYEKEEGAIEGLRDELLEDKLRAFLMKHADMS